MTSFHRSGSDAAAADPSDCTDLLAGENVCGKVARCWAAVSVGRYKGPRCPQPVKAAALAARTMVLTKIWVAFNIRKL